MLHICLYEMLCECICSGISNYCNQMVSFHSCTKSEIFKPLLQKNGCDLGEAGSALLLSRTHQDRLAFRLQM